MAFTDYTSQPKFNFDMDFTINTAENLSSNHKFNDAADIQQAPFALGTKGPSSLRGRDTPYKTTR